MQPPQKQPVTADYAVGLLVASGGDARLAAIRASRDLGYAVNDAALLAAISSDPNSVTALSKQLRVLMLLKTYETLQLLDIAFRQAIPDLRPEATAATYVKLVSSMSLMTEPRGADKETGDPIALLMKNLPAGVADAVEALIKQPDLQIQVGEPDGDVFPMTVPKSATIDND